MMEAQIETMYMSELQLMSVSKAAKVVKLDKSEILHACEIYIQSGGRDGLAYIEKGARKLIRAGSLKVWLTNLEKKTVAA